MNTNTAYSLETATSNSAPALTACAGTPAVRPGAGRPTVMTKQMVDGLCMVIRNTGTSDSGAAARMSLHPSTISRWKKENPDFAILLRTAREDFRGKHLAIIEAAAEMGGRAGWRASCWMLERVFPEDYSPRAAERARFAERFDAIAASELEGQALEMPDPGEPLQNVNNTPPLPAPPVPALPPRLAAPAPDVDLDLPLQLTPEGKLHPMDIYRAEMELRNVKNAALSGTIRPAPMVTKSAAPGDLGFDHGLHEAALPQPM